VLGHPVVATAILDRLLHHSHVITIRGDSYRLREKRRSGLIKTPALSGKRWHEHSANLDRGSPTGAHRYPPRIAAPDSRGSVRNARVPPVDSVDDPLRWRRHNGQISTGGQFFVSPGGQSRMSFDRRIGMARVTKCVGGGVAASKSPVDLPLRLDDATASPTTPQGQHQ
jgi:IstB-like ATP binding protein